MATPAIGIDKSNLSKTEQCKLVTFHFSMGIGRMRQIAAKVVAAQEGIATAEELNIRSGQAVVVTTAKASELRHQKRLIDSPELDEIRSQDNRLKRFIEAQSAAADTSTRFVLTSEVPAIWRVMEAYRTIRRPALVAAFMAKYRELEQHDFNGLRFALGDQFDRADYPPSDQVEAGFHFGYNIRNVGDVNLQGLPAEIIASEVAKEQEHRAKMVDEFKQVLRYTFKKLVETLFDTVKPQTGEKKRRFYDSSVENLLTFVNNYSKQDMANDVEMQAVVTSIKQAMNGITPDILKESEGMKKFVHDELNKVKQTIGALTTESGRKFR